MEQDKIKQAFLKAKQDIDVLKETLSYLSQDVLEIKTTLKALIDYEAHKQKLQQTNQQTHIPANQHLNPAQNIQIPTQNPQNLSLNEHHPTHSSIPTQGMSYNPLKQHFTGISTGNEGVPTNQPTNQQTNQHPIISTENLSQKEAFSHEKIQENTEKSSKINKKDKIAHLEQVSEILSTLDNIKKDLRHKFKRLTEKEMLIFSTIYQLEEQGFPVDYLLLSEKLGLSEISVRDYIHKLIKKDIPIQKFRESNRKITLSISKNLKKIASLTTILSLREL